MKTRFLLGVAVAVTAAACGPNVRVTTAAAPDASFASLHTFRIMAPPARRAGTAAPEDPMLLNSISNQILRDNISNSFAAKGYTRDQAVGDFDIAYYASARERLDVSMWDYGYPGRWGGWRGNDGSVAVPYTQGTVIIDVIDPKSKELLWRGRGVAETSDDPGEFQANLAKTVQAIVASFPAASRMGGGSGGN